MPNSADKPIEVEPALDEDSDVIELTEEVPEEEGGFDLFDDFAMPEFRMPGESPATASAPAAGADAQPGAQAGDPSAPANDAANKDNVPGAAILGRRPPRARQETPMMETVKLGLHDIDKAIAEQREEQERELQATEQLSAVSRDPGALPEESEVIELEQPVVEEPEPPAPALKAEDSEVLLEDPVEDSSTQVLGSMPSATPILEPEQEVVLDDLEGEPIDLDDVVEPEPEPEALEELQPEPLEAGDALLEVDHDPPAEQAQAQPGPTGDLDEPSTPTMLIGGSSPSQQSEPEPEADPVPDDSDERGFDRQELVRTMQMQAVDRDEIDLAIELERLDSAIVLETQRFAPDVLVAPPRVLTKQWREGSPLEQKQPPAPAAPASKPPPVKAAQPPVPAAQQQAPKPEQAPAQAAPPRPAQQAQAAPPQQQPQQAPAQGAAPGRPVANRPQQQQQQAQQPAAPVDDEMKGLVDELLDEGAAKKPAPKPRRKLSPRDNWFREVFTDEYLRTLPPNLDQVTERDCKFIERSLSLQPGSRILDLACGFGRHALSLAPRKFDVVGLDLSMALLQRGLAEAQRRNLSIKFVHGDMRSMNFNAIFDGCYLWQTSFGYFDDQTNLKVLQGIHHSLKPGGRFLLDIVNRDFIVTEMPSRCWWEGRECIFLEETDFDHVTSTLHTKRSFIYEDGTPPLEQNSYVRLYSLHELLALFPRAGFRVLEVSGGLHHRGRFLGPNSPRIIVLAEKVINQKPKAPNPQQQQQQPKG